MLVFNNCHAPLGQKEQGGKIVYHPQPQIQSTQELAGILFDLVDSLRGAQSLTDVNIAAGIAWNELLGLELETLTASRFGSGADLIELTADGPDELGQVLDLPL